MRAGWENRRINEIAEIKGGKRLPKGEKLQFEPTPYPYLTVGDFTDDGTIDPSNVRYVSAKAREKIKAYIIRDSDIYVSIAGTIGRTGIVPKIFDGAQLTENACRLVLRSEVNNRFIYYFTKSSSFIDQATEQTRTAAQPKLALGRLGEIKLNIPPFDEQRRIVAVLDKAFAAIATANANAQKNQSNARALFDEYVENLFTKKGVDWLDRTLAEVCEKITDGTHQTPKYFDQGYVFLSSRNVKNRVIDWDNIKYVDEAQHVAMQKRLKPRVGDILLAKNGTTGVAAMVDRDLVFDIYVSLALLRPLSGLSPEFLLHFVNSPIAKRQFNKRLKGTGVPNLHLEEIREVVISFPRSSDGQKKVVEQLDLLLRYVSDLEGNFSRKLTALAELKQSLLQKAFAGDLTAAVADELAEAAE